MEAQPEELRPHGSLSPPPPPIILLPFSHQMEGNGSATHTHPPSKIQKPAVFLEIHVDPAPLPRAETGTSLRQSFHGVIICWHEICYWFAKRLSWSAVYFRWRNTGLEFADC